MKNMELYAPMQKELIGMAITLADEVGKSPDLLAWEQLRAVFTTICLAYHIEADTLHCDALLSVLQDHSKTLSGKRFEDFMLGHII